MDREDHTQGFSPGVPGVPPCLPVLLTPFAQRTVGGGRRAEQRFLLAGPPQKSREPQLVLNISNSNDGVDMRHLGAKLHMDEHI